MIPDWFHYNPWLTIPAVVMAGALLIQVWFYLHYYAGINKQSRRIRKGLINHNQEQPPVSVIICARDQADILAKYLPAIFNQQYPNFQVIVVNDASSDNTEDVLQEFEQHPNFYHTFVPKGVRSVSARKMAMTIGIKAAIHDYVIFTDTSCIPESNGWIASMMRNFDADGDVVFGYASLRDKKGFLKQFVAYENLFSALQSFGFALAGRPYMAMPSNLAFRRELFFRNKGFSSHLFLKSGDDDLLIGEIANATNTRVEISPESKMHIERQNAWYFWKEQTISHFSTANQYKPFVRFLLALEASTRCIFYGLFLYLLIVCSFLFSYEWLLLSVTFFLGRLAIQLIVVGKSASQLGEPRFYLSIPFYDLILPVVKLFIRLFNGSNRNNAYTWEVLK